MPAPVQLTVTSGAIDLAGWIVGLAGIALAAAWLAYLYR